MEASREIELEGHIIDSGIMTLVFDRIMDMGGSFEMLVFTIGKKKTDQSYARLRVNAESEEKLNQILSELHRYGARQLRIEDVCIVPAEGDHVVPKGFYSTTNHPTSVKFRGEWIQVEEIEMDCLIVVDIRDGTARCTPISKLKRGDHVVVGEQGVRIVPPERPRERTNFEFMHGTVSPERPSETLIAKIATEILNIHRKGGKIALVGGPAIIHTGAARALAEIIRKGYINVLFAGNALATHDIEYDLFGTSLGMDISTGKPVTGGHKHHIYAISEIMRAGSIRNAVDQGVITGGIMYRVREARCPLRPCGVDPGRRTAAGRDHRRDGSPGPDARATQELQHGTHDCHPPPLDRGRELPPELRKDRLCRYQPDIGHQAHGQGHDAGDRCGKRCGHVPPAAREADSISRAAWSLRVTTA